MALPGKTVDRAFFFLLLVAITLAFYGLIADFAKPLFWALVLALLFQPLQRYMLRVIPDRPSLDALITMLTIVFLVLIPVFLVVLAVAREAARAQIHILIERVAHREEELPGRDVVGHAGGAVRAEENGGAPTNLVEAAVRDHLAGLQVALGAPRMPSEGEPNAMPSRGRAENLDSDRHDLLTDPISGDDGDLIGAAAVGGCWDGRIPRRHHVRGEARSARCGQE